MLIDCSAVTALMDLGILTLNVANFKDVSEKSGKCDNVTCVTSVQTTPITNIHDGEILRYKIAVSVNLR